MKIPQRYKGICWFLLQCLTTSITFAIVRFAMEGINIFTMTFIQTCFALALIFPFVAKEGLQIFKTKRLKLHVIRNIFGFTGTLCIFYGVTKIPLNDATAISFTGPLFTTLAAIILLKEKVKYYRAIGMIIGFIGAMVIIRPSAEFDFNSLFIVASVILMGFVQIFIAQLNKTEPVKRILFYMIFLTVLMTAPFAAFNWITPSWANIGWIFILTLFIFLNLFGTINAYRHAEVNVLMPLDFSRLIFTALVAYFLFDEHLNMITVIGSVIILGGIIYVLHNERKEHKKFPIL